jgi:ATP-dependent RNA helicase DeaD
VKPGNIVGAVANEAGIEGDFIGPIKIHDSHSTIDLPEGMPRDIYQTLQNTRVVGKQLRLSTSSDERDPSGPRQGNGHRSDKPRGAKPKGGKGFARGKAAHAGKAVHAGKRKKRKAKV